ncbi:hypothetical protein RRG08_031861 [Elysia crispata]|uniref:Cysteine-rich PDZ-binding protein n=1 Tax=Elysia crispata TaxID=231223 RepID=A0AAE0Z7X3_9GAST|nr:hypothetical protein RRG08_031861 [Elysia crispata]
MVCEKCQKKLGKGVITPDPWKSGARNTTEGGGRKVGENKALTAKKTGLILIRPALRNVGSVRLVFISQAHTTVRVSLQNT